MRPVHSVSPKSQYRIIFVCFSFFIAPLLSSCATFFEDDGSHPDDYLYSSYEGAEREPAQYSARFQTASASRSGDVGVGMRMSDVEGSWGEPSTKLSAGNPQQGNQKWVYRSPSTRYGIEPERVIYFENGRVIGWETKTR